MKFKLRLLLSLLPFADPFADDGEAPFRQNLRSEINRILFSFFFSWISSNVENVRTTSQHGTFPISNDGTSRNEKIPIRRIEEQNVTSYTSSTE